MTDQPDIAGARGVDPGYVEARRVLLDYLEKLFGRRGARGTEMAVRALRVGMPEASVETLCTGYTERLLGVARA